MYLTEQDYIRIEKDLASRAVKDSQFTEAITTKDDDQVTILQDQINKRISLQKLVQYVSLKLNLTALQNALDNKLNKTDIVQQQGPADNKIMSQVAVRDSINTTIAYLESVIQETADAQTLDYMQRIEVLNVATQIALEQKANLDHVFVDDSDYDFSIGDQQGNVLVGFRNGHIITKNFDSSQTK